MTAWTRVQTRTALSVTLAAVVGLAPLSVSAAPVLPSSVVKTGVAPAKDASLKSLTITAPKNVQISPALNATLFKYSAVVPAGTTKVTFAAVPTQKAATVTITAPTSYVPGNNNVTILVTATDKKTTASYIVTVFVLRAATLSIDAASLTLVPGGYTVKVTALNASIAPSVKKDTTPACAAADPYVSIASGPDAKGVALLKVEGSAAGCAVTLTVNGTASDGYGLGTAVVSVKGTPTSTAAGFNRKPTVSTDDGFYFDYTVSNATVTCALVSAPDTATFDQSATRVTVTGLSVVDMPDGSQVAQSATVRCIFTPNAGVVALDPVEVTGYPTQQAVLTSTDSVSTDDGFSFKVTAIGCVPRAVISTGPKTGAVKFAAPAGNVYKGTVSGLAAGQTATVTVTCPGNPGFNDAESVDIDGAVVDAAKLGLITEPRIADASNANGKFLEGQLPDPQPGTQPSVLYATSPEWSPWNATGKNTFEWQISSAQYDSDGVSCLDAAATVSWGVLARVAGENPWWDSSNPHLLYVGDLLAQRPSVVGKCVRVNVTGTLGTRTSSVISAPVAVAPAQAPRTCSAPQVIGASGDTFAVNGDVVSGRVGQCANANGLAVRTEWQVSAVAAPSGDSDWSTLTRNANLTVSNAVKNSWIRFKVTYVAARSSRSFYSARVAISGSSQAPVNTSAPSIGCTAGTWCVGLNVNNSVLRMNSLGTWTNAGGNDVAITWQYSPDNKPNSWQDQSVLDADGNAIQASYRFVLGSLPGYYRAKVTFASFAGSFAPVSAFSNTVTWATSQ